MDTSVTWRGVVESIRTFYQQHPPGPSLKETLANDGAALEERLSLRARQSETTRQYWQTRKAQAATVGREGRSPDSPGGRGVSAGRTLLLPSVPRFGQHSRSARPQSDGSSGAGGGSGTEGGCTAAWQKAA